MKWVCSADVASLLARFLGCCQCSTRIHFVDYLTITMNKLWLVCQFLSFTSKENSNNEPLADKYLHFESDRVALQQIKNKHFSCISHHRWACSKWDTNNYSTLLPSLIFINAILIFTNFLTKTMLHRCPYNCDISYYHQSVSLKSRLIIFINFNSFWSSPAISEECLFSF